MRIKGAICLPGHPTVFELQGVEDVFEVKATNSSVSIYNGETRILVIGEELSAEKLYELLKVKKEWREEWYCK
jgi:hypothetical protein